MADGAPQLYAEYENNIALNWVAADHAGTRAAFATAADKGLDMVEIDVVNSRVIINALETRPMIAGPGERPGTLDIWCGTQGPVPIAEKLAVVLNMPVSDVRVRTPDVGGGLDTRFSSILNRWRLPGGAAAWPQGQVAAGTLRWLSVGSARA